MSSALNLSQEELAHALGVSFATVNRWENGKTNPSELAEAIRVILLGKAKTGRAPWLRRLTTEPGPIESGRANS